MTKKTIDEVKDLMNLQEDDLNELLINEKYNKANLRELVRRSLIVANEYKTAFEYERNQSKEREERLKIYNKDRRNV